MTATLGTTAPEESVTRPVIVEVPIWAKRKNGSGAKGREKAHRIPLRVEYLSHRDEVLASLRTQF